MRRDRSGEPGALTSWRLLLAIVAVLTLTVAAGVWRFQREIRDRTIDSTTQSVVIISSLVVNRSITLNDITDGLHRSNRAALDADIILLKDRQELVGLRIWSLTTGGLVYTDPDHPDAGSLLDADRRSQGVSGRTFHEMDTDAASGLEVFRIYYPFDANGDRTMDAMAEVLLPRNDVDARIARSNQVLYSVGAFMLLAALAGVLLVRRGQRIRDRAAVHDTLTGLGNRVLLRRHAAQILPHIHQTPVALLLIDLDGFKGVNDTLGHQAGDELLVVVSHALVELVGKTGTVVRLGGDEFAVLIRGDIEEATDLAGRVHDAVRRPLVVGGMPVEIDGSVGVAAAPRDTTRLDGLMHCADVAMYQAKRRGGGVVIYSEGASSDATDSVTVVPELRSALAAGQLEVHYQPVLTSDGRVHEVEALLRWRHPVHGLMEAADFVPAVERTAMMWHVTSWVLQKAFHDCRDWQARGVAAAVSVNLTLRDVIDRNLPDRIATLLDDAGLAPQSVRLEIAEAALLQAPERVAESMRKLHDIGVGLTIDDVGAAYRAMTTMILPPFDQVKIDGQLLTGAAGSASARTAIRQVALFARGLGVATTAKGIEQRGTCADTWHGCNQIQGFGVCVPLPADQLMQWLLVNERDLPALAPHRQEENVR